MASKATEKALANHPFNKNRLKTDTFFSLPGGSVKLQGNLDHAIRFIEDFQLMDPALWTKFVDQFRNTPEKADDHDLGWRGEYWGKMMRGACFTYQYTQNPELYDILTETVKDMLTAQDENGRISSYSYEKQYHGWDMWSRKYVLLGMQYYIEICKEPELIAKITDSMKKQADYLISTIGPKSEGKTEITETSNFWLGMNSSSILEPIVRLYNLTSEKKYLDFATYIVDRGVISDPNVNIFEEALLDEKAPYEYKVTKAYEMMSCFEGLLEYYRVTGIEKWKTAVVNFANKVRLTDISVIGSAGCTHELFDHTLVRQSNTTYNGVMQETCVTVTWLKFCYQVLCLTGDPVYADEMEKSIYNALLGAINFDKLEVNGKLPFDSYSPLLFNTRNRGVGGKKTFTDGTFYGCCACIGSAGTGVIGMGTGMLTKDGIAINFFSSGQLKAVSPSGEDIIIKTETDYPADGTVCFTVMSDVPSEYDIAIRIPEWSENNVVSVNGVRDNCSSGKYAHFKRLWKKGDFIAVKLDMSCKLIKAVPDPRDENSAFHVALRRGPLMLARDARLGDDIESIVDFDDDNIECEIGNFARYDHYYSFIVTDKAGNKIKMTDYASAGRTWDVDSMTTVWLPTKNYWAVDLLKPVYVSAPHIWDDSDEKYNFTVSSSNQVMVSGSRGDAFIFEQSQAKGEMELYKIKVASSGLYLDVIEGVVTATANGMLWKVKKFAQNRYRISSPDENFYICGTYKYDNPFITVRPMEVRPTQVLRFDN